MTLLPAAHAEGAHGWLSLARQQTFQPLCDALPTKKRVALPSIASSALCTPNHYNRTMPSAAEIKSLFRQYLRLGKQFHNYNIKHYITRRAKEEFHSLAARSDAATEAAWQRAKSELDVWKRQAVVYQLYGRKLKNVMELDAAAQRHN